MFLVDHLRGMQDVLPPESDFYSKVELLMRSRAEFYGFSLIRTPILEFTELFNRSAGDSSDIVQKEMYTFEDKSGRSVTLRPEFTASVLRAVVNGLYGNAVWPLKLMYFGPCYRYERPQAGRYREFFQFGVEIFGAPLVLADLELICLACDIFNKLGIRNFNLEINAIGCKNCRKNYLDAVKKFFVSIKDKLCETCKNRLNINPMRIFDCKNPECKNLFKNAPHTIDFVCSECLKEFEYLKKLFKINSIKYIVNTRIVRGLDYYTKFVFEFVVNFDGVDLTVCGGGRYDNLSASLGGPDLSATGFGIGFERIVKLLQKSNFNKNKQKIKVYIAYMSENAKFMAAAIVSELRNLGIRTDFDIVGRGIKSQMKYANKLDYNFVAVIGDDELNKNIINLKNMQNSKEISFNLDTFTRDVYNYLKKSFNNSEFDILNS
jgi:histidyl-tRNA synthetase